jgi:ELWxxDGT repeat protein
MAMKKRLLVCAALGTLGLMAACGGGGSGGVSLDDLLLFAGDDGTTGMELWSHDGRGSPTLVENLVPDTPGNVEGSYPEYFIRFGNLVYFSGENETGTSCIYATDGSSAWLVTVGVSLSSPAVLDSRIYYRSYNQSASRYGLWQFDGTDASEITASNVFYDYLTYYNGNIIMRGYPPGSPTNVEPMIYDGVDITMIENINPSGGSFPTNFTEYNGNLYFIARDDGSDAELWATDGSSAWMVTPEINVSGSANIQYPTVYDGLLYFGADDGVNGRELWASDGSSSWMVTPEINGSGSSSPAYLTVCNGKLFFGADDGVNGRELWQYDSALDSLQKAAEINTAPGASSSDPTGISYDPQKFLCLDGNLYFGAEVGSQGYEMYVFDGSNARLVGGSEMNPSDDFWFMGF